MPNASSHLEQSCLDHMLAFMHFGLHGQDQKVYVIYICQGCTQLLKQITILEEDVMKEQKHSVNANMNGWHSCLDNLLEGCQLFEESTT